MAGLFGLFGKKNNQPQQPKQPKEAFFLEPDDAKTFGDIDYMRKSKTVRRTFPKTASNKEGGELIQEVSSIKMATKTSSQVSRSSEATTSSQNDSTTSSFTPQRTKTDTSMDMFRNMAKKIKK